MFPGISKFTSFLLTNRQPRASKSFKHYRN